MATIIVCGGRKFATTDLKERLAVFAILDGIHASTPVSLVVHGNAKGADRCAKRWAETRGVPEKGYDADWEDIDVPGAVVRYHDDGTPYNAAAGNLRNRRMLDEHPEVELVVAFPGGRGTADMCQAARHRHIPIEHHLQHYPSP